METNRFLSFKNVMFLTLSICFLGIMVSFKTLENADAPSKHVVTIYKMKFDPAILNVKKGDTVVWINKDFYQHDVTEMTSEKWHSKPLNKGEQYARVIKQDVKYICNLHKVMKGTITVVK